jgi:hypothetical protein
MRNSHLALALKQRQGMGGSSAEVALTYPGYWRHLIKRSVPPLCPHAHGVARSSFSPPLYGLDVIEASRSETVLPTPRVGARSISLLSVSC